MRHQSRRPRRGDLALAAALLAAILCPGFAAPVVASEHTVFYKLLDASGNPVVDLQPAQITIFEDGVKRETKSVELINWPTKINLLVDNGPGTSLVELRNGLTGFFEALPEGVTVALYTINPQPRRIVGPTADHAELMRGLGLIAPDRGAARFLEGLLEASKRIDDDKEDKFSVIMMVAADGAEGSAVRERDIERLSQQLLDNRVRLHVAMISLGGQRASASSGQVQVELGLSYTKMTGGRYENIAAVTRLATLLPEFGELIAGAHRRQANQYRITYERPDGAPDPTKGISMTTTRSGRGTLTFDGVIPE
jgi:hypothetical protein